MDSIPAEQSLSEWSITRRAVLGSLGVVVGIAAVGSELLFPEAAEATGSWGGYIDNGQIPLSALTPIGGYYLQPDAATNMASLRAAYQQHFGTSLNLIDGYRSLSDQWRLWNSYQAGTGNLAAYPGTSNHGWGLAVDFNNPIHSHTQPYFQWLQDNAGTYGWWWAGQTFRQIENWHWEYIGPISGKPQASNTEDDDMKIYANVTTNEWVIAGPGTWYSLPADGSLNALMTTTYGTRIAVDNYTFNLLHSAFSSTKIYANASTNQWAAGGAGVWLVLDSSNTNFLVIAYGYRVALADADWNTMRTLCLSGAV